ncbi:MAG: molybdopterin-dependent oxidoreductase [Candidatus Promineifilaceae bacterium]
MASQLNRRQFLQMSAATVSTAAVMAGLQSLLSPHATIETKAKLQTSAEESVIPGVCLLCPSGCGILTRVVDGRAVKLEGSPMHPINLGALCPKGQAAPELLYNPDRLTGPMRRTGARGEGKWESISWDEAIEIVSGRLVALREAGHPEQAVLMHGEARGQLWEFFRRFMSAVGSPNVVSRESLNTAAAKLATYLTQGVYDTPNYDIENANYILSFGASLLEAGPVPQRIISGYSFMRRGRSTRGKVVIIDPRQGVSGAKADEWIPILPGTDAALALGMAHVIIRSGLVDAGFVNDYSFGYEDFPDETGTRLIQGFKNFVLENYAPEKVAEITGLSSTTIARLAGEFAGNKPAVAILPGKGGLLNGTFGGVYAAMAIHCLNALVGSIETRGGVLTQRYPIQRPWPKLPSDPIADGGCRAERVDGAGTLFPVARDAYQVVATRILEGYPVDLLMLYDANPIFEAPGGAQFIEAFEKVSLVVAYTAFMDETAAYADLVLPEPTFLERYEDHFIEGLGYPGVGLRQPVVIPRYDTRSIGDFLLKVSDEMGGPLADAFPWHTYQGLLQYRLLDVGTDWDTLQQLGVWLTPGYRFARRGSEKWVNEVIGSDRRGAPRDGYFDFYSRELKCLLGDLDADQLAALGLSEVNEAVYLPQYLPTAFAGESNEYPFVLNVITLMSLGPYSAAANMPTLQEISGMTVNETWGSWLEMNPETANKLGLEDEDEVWVESPFGKVKVKLRLVMALRPDVVNLPFNQGHTAVGRWARDRGVNGIDLLNPATEPVSGLASFTNTRAKVYKA